MASQFGKARQNKYLLPDKEHHDHTPFRVPSQARKLAQTIEKLLKSAAWDSLLAERIKALRASEAGPAIQNRTRD
jgi:hypothetical protein